jgi:hypothetical protein
MVINVTFDNISVIIKSMQSVGGGNLSTRRNPPTFRMSLTNFITYNVVSSTSHHEWGSNSQL